MSLQVSIVINTYNRAPYLRRLLASLGHLYGSPFEVVVVNGPSTDDTEMVLRSYQDHLKIVQCPTRNLSNSRNLGIASAAGDIILFIDDDALPASPDWLLSYSEIFENDAEINLGAIGGSVLHRDTKYFEFAGGSTSEYGFQVFNGNPDSDTAPDGGPRQIGVQGCNCAFRRNALTAIGGFDESYKYYLDETDACFRLGHVGYRVLYSPKNSVRHYSASSERRTSHFDRNWDVITRSDTYFALKNGSDLILRRFFKTLFFAPQKHFVQEINNFYKKGDISRVHWLRLKCQWLLGLICGLWVGLAHKRRLCDFSTPPPPFLPFHPPYPQVKKPLRIALLTQTIPGHSNYGGIGRYTYDLARGLYNRGHEVHILCQSEQTIHYEGLGFLIHGLPASQTRPPVIAGPRLILNKNLGYALEIERKLADLYAKGIEFDIVHASNWDAEAVAVIREHIYPTTLMLVTPLAQVIRTEKWPFNDDLKTCVALDRWQIEHADTVCVPSNGVLKSYHELMTINDSTIQKMKCVRLGIYPNDASIETHSSDVYKLLFVGRLERRKGIHTLLKVIPELLSEFPKWECHLVGNDKLVTSTDKTFKEVFTIQHEKQPWFKRVVFHGEVSEQQLEQYYKECDLFVAPSLFESFGLIFQEAMKYGKAVIGCRTGGVPEVVEDGVEGLLVEPESSNELFQALKKLMSNESLRKRMGQAGFNRIQKKDNYLTMTLNMEKIYYETISKVGDERANCRKRLWLREIPIFDPSFQTMFRGKWEIKVTDLGNRYLLGNPGASLILHSHGDTSIRLAVLKHNRSGVLKVEIKGFPPQYIDLFQECFSQQEYSIDIPLPGSFDELQEITISIMSEHNPESFSTEVWISQLLGVL